MPITTSKFNPTNESRLSPTPEAGDEAAGEIRLDKETLRDLEVIDAEQVRGATGGMHCSHNAN